MSVWKHDLILSLDSFKWRSMISARNKQGAVRAVILVAALFFGLEPVILDNELSSTEWWREWELAHGLKFFRYVYYKNGNGARRYLKSTNPISILNEETEKLTRKQNEESAKECEVDEVAMPVQTRLKLGLED